jgi:hypothetical protein
LDGAPPESVADEPVLRRVHLAVLAILAGSALAIATLGAQSPEPGSEPPFYSLAAVALAALAILSRGALVGPAPRLPHMRRRAVTSLLCAGALGALGLGVGISEAQQQTGLLYTLAGALLALRPPARRVDAVEDPEP